MLATTIIASSMAFIDGTVVNVALPALQTSLNATAVDVQWVIEAYSLLLSALLLVGGSLGDHYGRRRVFVIGVALFRERAPAPSGPPKIASRESAGQADEARTAPSGAPPTAAPRALAPAPGLGTGHGERESSYVADTEFVRLQSQPNELIRIRYDSLENLVAQGVIRRPHPVLPVVNPFPASPERAFVPDPPG